MSRPRWKPAVKAFRGDLRAGRAVPRGQGIAGGRIARRIQDLQDECEVLAFKPAENGRRQKTVHFWGLGIKLPLRAFLPLERKPMSKRIFSSPLLLACFAAYLPSCCNTENPGVKPEPVPSANVQPSPIAPTPSTAPWASASESAVPNPSSTVAEPASSYADTSSSAEAPRSGPPKPPPPIPLPRVRPLGAKEVAAVIVRSKRGPKPEESTQFIHADGKITTKKGAYLFINGQLHRYRQQEKTSPNPPCEGEKENPFPKRIWRNAEFVPEKNGKSLEVIPVYKPNPKDEQIIHTETEHELTAAIPGFVFIKSFTTDYGCGAHALYGAEFSLFAFQSDGSAKSIESSEYLEGTDAWIEHARAKFNAQVSPGESPESLDARIEDNDAVKVGMVFPMLTAKGAVWTGLFTAPATWAGSFGGWGGYTRAIPMALNKTPARFRDAMITPEPVNEYVAKNEKDLDMVGFTVGEAEN